LGWASPGCDSLLDDLIDQINHLPPRSCLFGLGAHAKEEHFAMIRQLIGTDYVTGIRRTDGVNQVVIYDLSARGR
jgi:hypothetical protein